MHLVLRASRGRLLTPALKFFGGFAFFSGCGCEARVTGRILLEGLKVVLDRCASSRFRVVVAVRLRGGDRRRCLQWNGIEGKGKEKLRACKGLGTDATVGTKL